MNTLKAEKRSMDVKAKKLRREGFVTGNLFGKAIEGSIPLKMDRFEVERLLKTDHKGSQIMLNVEGQDYDVLIKEVDYNAMKRCVDEIDFQALVSTEKVHSTAAVQIENREKVLEGALQECLEEIKGHFLTNVFLKALPAALVDHVTVDVAGMKVGDVIRVKDLEISKNPDVDIHTDPEAIVVMVDAIRNSIPEDEEADEEAAEE